MQKSPIFVVADTQLISMICKLAILYYKWKFNHNCIYQNKKELILFKIIAIDFSWIA